MARTTSSTATRPRRSHPTTVTDDANASEARRTAECSTAGTTTCPPARSTAPQTAAAMASVAPLVNTTERGRQPSMAATAARPSSTATRTASASLCIRPGSPTAPVSSHAAIASARRREQRRGGRVVEVVAGHGSVARTT